MGVLNSELASVRTHLYSIAWCLRNLSVLWTKISIVLMLTVLTH